MRWHFIRNNTGGSSTQISTIHLAKSYIIKSSPKFTCYTTNTVSDVYLFSLVFTQFTYFPQDVSETHTLLRSTELQLILHYDALHGQKGAVGPCPPPPLEKSLGKQIIYILILNDIFILLYLFNIISP